jgi:2-dehydro-3-deoxygluconokinase
MMEKSFDLITFGEAMLRLSPPHYQRLEQCSSLEVHVGGSELNVAVGASKLGLSASWVSAVPDNQLGRLVINRVREQDIDTSYVIFSEVGRLGIYFLELGASPRASQVLYDRQYSSISMADPQKFNWEDILGRSRAFHVSGITPALSKYTADATADALKAARKVGCLTSYDLNYRAKLWSEAEARKCQEPLMQYIDVLITTEEDTRRVFGMAGDNYKQTARLLAEKFGFRAVAITMRGDLSVLRNNWTAIAFYEGKIYDDKTYEVEIIDRVGAGDSFVAGFIYGMLQDDIKKGLRYGNAMAAIKHSIPGDFCLTDIGEVEALTKGAGLRIAR